MRVDVGRDADDDAPRVAQAEQCTVEKEEREEARHERARETIYDDEDDSNKEGWVL